MIAPLYLVHGFAFHGGVFAPLAAALAERGQAVARLDLPGYGGVPALSGQGAAPDQDDGVPHQAAANAAANAAAAVAAALVARSRPGATWVAWSLGALYALQVATEYPGHIARLVLLGATPRFVAGPGWPHAVAPALLAGFDQDLARAPKRLLHRLVGLAAHGDPAARAIRPGLEAALVPAPSPATLAAGLAALAGLDLRPALAQLAIPCQVLLGAADPLVPAALADDWRRLLPGARVEILPGAGHAPFLSAPTAVAAAILSADPGLLADPALGSAPDLDHG